MSWQRIPLFWRVFATYVAILVLAFLLLVFAPVTVSIPVALTELAVLVGGLLAMSLLTLTLLRPVFRPLDTITRAMRRVDLLAPGQRVAVAGEPGVAAVAQAFNEMLDRLERERRESARLALAAQEEERRRVARELHDEVGQVFTGIVLQVESLAQRLPSEYQAELDTLREAARSGATSVRGIAVRLRPELLDDLGLQRALQALANAVGEQARLVVEHTIEPPPQLSAEAELVVYRVAQEALTNVVRHAQATTVRLSFRREDGATVLRVRDDGVGMPADAATSGIQGMRERALLIAAQLTIEASGDGTEVSLRL